MGLINFDFLSVLEWIWLATGILILSIVLGGMIVIYYLKNKKPSSGYQGRSVYVG